MSMSWAAVLLPTAISQLWDLHEDCKICRKINLLPNFLHSDDKFDWRGEDHHIGLKSLRWQTKSVGPLSVVWRNMNQAIWFHLDWAETAYAFGASGSPSLALFNSSCFGDILFWELYQLQICWRKICWQTKAADAFLALVMTSSPSHHSDQKYSYDQVKLIIFFSFVKVGIIIVHRLILPHNVFPHYQIIELLGIFEWQLQQTSDPVRWATALITKGGLKHFEISLVNTMPWI